MSQRDKFNTLRECIISSRRKLEDINEILLYLQLVENSPLSNIGFQSLDYVQSYNNMFDRMYELIQRYNIFDSEYRANTGDSGYGISHLLVRHLNNNLLKIYPKIIDKRIFNNEGELIGLQGVNITGNVEDYLERYKTHYSNNFQNELLLQFKLIFHIVLQYDNKVKLLEIDPEHIFDLIIMHTYMINRKHKLYTRTFH